MYEDSVHEAYWAALHTQVPVTVLAGGLLARADGCLAWVQNVRLYDAGVLFDMSLIVSPARLSELGMPYVNMTGHPGLMDEPPEVETRVVIDGVRTTSADGSLHNAGGDSSPGTSHATWWIPGVPASLVLVGISWPHAAFAGEHVMDAESWPDQIPEVLRI